jgi:hypothetical protein
MQGRGSRFSFPAGVASDGRAASSLFGRIDPASCELDGLAVKYDMFRCMRLIRTIMAVTIALSVALLPTAGSAGFVMDSKAPDAKSESMTEDMAKDDLTQVDMAQEMAMASDSASAMDCCPDHAKSAPNGHSDHRCPMVCCTTSFVSIAASGALDFDLPILAGLALPIPMDQVASPHSGSPPFRPPRV